MLRYRAISVAAVGITAVLCGCSDKPVPSNQPAAMVEQPAAGATPAEPTPVPIPYPNNAAAKDKGTGQATGKHQHGPILAK